MTIKDIVKAYSDELSRWDFFSDSQRAYVNDEGYIVVCLRNYNWYITKEPIKSNLTAVKALFEIDWIAEYDDCEESSNINFSIYWKET